MAKNPLGRLEARALEGFRAVEVLAVAQRLTKREGDRLAKLGSGLALRDWIKL